MTEERSRTTAATAERLRLALADHNSEAVREAIILLLRDTVTSVLEWARPLKKTDESVVWAVETQDIFDEVNKMERAINEGVFG